MVIQQQLQVTNCAAILGSQSGEPVIANIECYDCQGHTEVN